MRNGTAVTAILVLLLMAGCSRRRPPEPPASTPVSAAREDGGSPSDPNAEAARRAAEEARLREMARLRAALEEMVFFDFDDSRIRSDASSILQQKVPILRDHQGVQLLITGHADERGSGEYNLALGLRRANSVREFLASFGIVASRIITDTMGEDRPLDTRQTEAGWARNRRAESSVVNADALVVR